MSDVAVVIPAHDSARWLGEAIASVRAQSVPVAELVVVDDGSRDDSADLAERAGARVVRQENAGPGAARNRGLAATRSPLVAFLDADDRFLPEKLARQLPALADPRVAACCSDAWLLRDGERVGRKNAGRDVPEALTFDLLLRGNPVVMSSVVARRDALLRAGGFDEDSVLIATEDYDLWLRLSREGRLVYQDEPLCDYRVHEHGLSDNERFLRGVDRIMQKVVARWGSEPGVEAAAARRRGGVRVDLAWDALQAGDRAQARAWLRAARSLGGGGAKGWKLWLRSLLPLPTSRSCARSRAGP
jgi:GT2 family glycosyltransferase